MPRRRNRVLVLLGAIALSVLVGAYTVVPYPWTLRERNPERTALIEQRIEEAARAGRDLEIRQDWVPLEQMSPALLRAVVVAEDYRFREHEGIDWISLGEEVRWTGDGQFSWWSPADLRALGRALSFAWANRDEMRGRSTITQQLAKNLYFGTDRTLRRKAMEFVVARRLEGRLDKDRILELYLNVAEWGPGIFGAEAASRAYFGRSASTLALAQAAALAATLPHPLTSNPSRNPERMAWRQALILDRLDPTRGIPPPPGPIPLPDIELVMPGVPAFEPIEPLIEPLEPDTIVADTLVPDTAAILPDTLRVQDSVPR